MKVLQIADTACGKGSIKDSNVPTSDIFLAAQGDLQRNHAHISADIYNKISSNTATADNLDGTTDAMPTRAINVNRLSPDASYSLRSGVCTPIGGTTATISLTYSGLAVDAESSTVPAGTFTALKPHSTDMFTQANGTTLVITGSDWIDVAILALPLFSRRLSIVIC
jgi:hypothetical protein